MSAGAGPVDAAAAVQHVTPELAAALAEKHGRRVRADLCAWCEHALAPQGFAPAAHHRLLIRELEAVERGEVTRLAIFMPPGSAKSTYTSALFPAWFMARNRNTRVIAASNTMPLAEYFSGQVQGYVRDNATALRIRLASENSKLWATNNGAMYKAIGMGGAIAGFRADLALIDDPIRLREEAESETIREKSWNWFMADLRTRLRPGGRIVLVQTRWHMDDLGGRLLETQRDGWRVVSLPATAREGDPLGRAVGELLWANDPTYRYGAEIARVKAEYEASGAMRDWWSLYEQDPRPAEGGLFRVAQVAALDAAPAGGVSVRAWDLAATAAVGTRDPDWTVGLRMTRHGDGSFVVDDVVRDRGGPDEVLALVLATASRDGRSVRISLPQDPGQAGKAQALDFVRRLAGHQVEATPESGDKATRAAPLAAQVNVGNVRIVRAPWNRPFLDELGVFPGGGKDDQVDAASRAFACLIAPPAPAKSIPFSLHAR